VAVFLSQTEEPRICSMQMKRDRFHAIEVRLVALAQCRREHRPRAFGGGPWGAQWMVSRLVIT
jgi:hypothetical protein